MCVCVRFQIALSGPGGGVWGFFGLCRDLGAVGSECLTWRQNNKGRYRAVTRCTQRPQYPNIA